MGDCEWLEVGVDDGESGEDRPPVDFDGLVWILRVCLILLGPGALLEGVIMDISAVGSVKAGAAACCDVDGNGIGLGLGFGVAATAAASLAGREEGS